MFGRLIALLKSDPTWLEIVSTVFLTIWSVLLMLPGDTFNNHSNYAAMNFMREEIWGTIGISLAAYGYHGLFTDSKAGRRFALLGGQFFWASVGMCFVLTDNGSTGGWVYLALALGCAIVNVSSRRP